MRVLIVCYIFALAMAIAQATVCKLKSECASSQCCYIKPEFEVVSKKRQSILPLQPISTHSDTGVCENYKLEGVPCWPLETMNGHCGCTPGTSCQFVPEPTLPAPTLVAIIQRSIYMPGPGSYQCVTKV
ncbi:uncharacterized protein LOC128210196 [Mya arenaria]|nr:uncharacterized protein LOC128210196 [Mya arenaria]